MSRDRPTEPPRAVPDAKRGKDLKPHQVRERQNIERLKVAGPGLLAAFFNPMMRAGMRAPKFIRIGYESNIVDELKDFYAARPRPWRPENCSSCTPTHKERLNAKRGGRHAPKAQRA